MTTNNYIISQIKDGRTVKNETCFFLFSLNLVTINEPFRKILKARVGQISNSKLKNKKHEPRINVLPLV